MLRWSLPSCAGLSALSCEVWQPSSPGGMALRGAPVGGRPRLWRALGPGVRVGSLLPCPGSHSAAAGTQDKGEPAFLAFGLSDPKKDCLNHIPAQSTSPCVWACGPVLGLWPLDDQGLPGRQAEHGPGPWEKRSWPGVSAADGSHLCVIFGTSCTSPLLQK